MRRVAPVLLSALLSGALLLGACASDDPVIGESPTPDAAPTDPATPTDPDLPTGTPSPDGETESGIDEGTEADVVLTATLSGASEVPGPGDPAGSGSFRGTIVLGEAAGELCYRLEVENVSSGVVAAHIHRGGPDESGDIFIPLAPPVDGPAEECLTVNATELVPLMDDPEGYYVNVHSQGHPDGAVRGQLQS